MVAIQEDFEDPHIFDEDDLGNDDEIIDIYKHSYWYICVLTVKRKKIRLIITTVSFNKRKTINIHFKFLLKIYLKENYTSLKRNLISAPVD